MKKYFRKILLFLIIIILTIFNSVVTYADDSVQQEISDDEIQIAEPAVKENEEEPIIPSEMIDTGMEDRENNENSNLQIMATSSTEENPTLISSEKDFAWGVLEDGTIAITGLSKNMSEYYKVKIPSTINGKTVSTIYNYAFEFETYLMEVELPSSVTSIYSNAFDYAVRLNNINLDNIVYIGSFAFDHTCLTEIHLGSKAKDIDAKSFIADNLISNISVDTSNPNFSSQDGILYNKNKTELVAYPSHKNNTVYTMPNSVKTVKDVAFYMNGYLTTVNLSTSITELPEYAFSGCINLSTINNLNNVTKYGDYCLGATAISSITLSANVTEVSALSFLNCEKLTTINVDGNNSKYTSVNGVLFSKDKTKLIAYPEGKSDSNYIIPNGTKTIGESAFQCAKFSQVTIPTSVNTFENWAFAQCKNLTSVTIPASITKINYGPFNGCLKLKSVVDNSACDLTYLMFGECVELTSVVLNNNIKVIENRAFYACTSLSSITLPTNLSEIWVAAFKECSKLLRVSIPANVTYIQSGAFDQKTVFDISKTKLIKLSNGDYRIVTDVYISGTFDYKKAFECLNLLNQKRKEAGLSPVKMDKDILTASMTRAAETALLFEHDRPNGTSCYSLNNKINSENIAAGSSTAAGAINQWMNSQSHKANMLTAGWKSVGIGCFTTSDGMTYWVQNFGDQTPNEQSTIPSNSTKEVKIQTIEDTVKNLSWKDKSTSIELSTNQSAKKEIRCVNNGWEYASVTLLNKSFNWTSSNNGIATVDSNGNITAKGSGTATITANVKSFNTSIKLNVNSVEKLPFNDVKKTDWFYQAVSYTYRNNIISGYNATTFAPNDKLTRGMIVTILYRMEGSPNNDGKSKFSDVSTKEYYAKAVKWAVNNGIVHGYDGTTKFGPNDNIIRQDLAAILKNYAGFKKKDIKSTTGLNKFKDYKSIDSYALSAMQWAVSKGVITGNDNGTLNPKGNATRAEAAAMIQKYCNKVGR